MFCIIVCDVLLLLIIHLIIRDLIIFILKTWNDIRICVKSICSHVIIKINEDVGSWIFKCALTVSWPLLLDIWIKNSFRLRFYSSIKCKSCFFEAVSNCTLANISPHFVQLYFALQRASFFYIVLFRVREDFSRDKTFFRVGDAFELERFELARFHCIIF